MATEKEQKPQETRKADPEREAERKPDKHPQEAHEGMPGYGQPPDGASEKKLPDQKW